MATINVKGKGLSKGCTNLDAMWKDSEKPVNQSS